MLGRGARQVDGTQHVHGRFGASAGGRGERESGGEKKVVNEMARDMEEVVEDSVAVVVVGGHDWLEVVGK